MSVDRTFQDAKRLYLEQYGDPMVTNTYLKIALTLVSVIAVGLLILDLKTIRTFENFRRPKRSRPTTFRGSLSMLRDLPAETQRAQNEKEVRH